MEATTTPQTEEPLTELPPGWQTGMPYYTFNPCTGTFLFELLLRDGRTIEAYVKYEDQGRAWIENPVHRRIDHAEIIGWRETYSCAEARQAIDRYVARPQSIVARDGAWADANYRHIRPEEDRNAIGCRPCACYFIGVWRARFGQTPEGWEELT